MRIYSDRGAWMNSCINELADKYINDVALLTSEMIKIPSISGDEGQLAEFLVKKMNELNYDHVWKDKAGNVIGKISGKSRGKSLVFNCHMDTVGEGNHDRWSYPPFSGRIAEGAVWGRGASDTKGALAAQIYSAAILKHEDMLPKGDIYVTGVVHEEDSGLGSKILLEDLRADYAVIGEATRGNIAIYHRGRIRFDIHVKGKSAHASIPESGVNPHYFLSKFICKLEELKTGEDPVYGRTSLVPTFIQTSETNTNIIPAELILTIDCRNVPGDNPGKLHEQLEKLVNECMFSGIDVYIERVKNTIRCYTGLIGEAYEGASAFKIDEDHELVQKSVEALQEVFGNKVKTIGWNFATDSGYFMQAGIPVIGFSTADESLCHTTEEHMSIDELKKGIIGNMALILNLCST